jgi:hypothetical protein
MARKPRILAKREEHELRRKILQIIPGSKRGAVTRRTLLRRLERHTNKRKIPQSTVIRLVQALHREGHINISTRVGIWRRGKGDDAPVKKAARKTRGGITKRVPRGTLQHPHRRIRKVTSFVCTRCYQTFPTKSTARHHLDNEH